MDDMVVYMKEKSILYEIKSLEKLIARTFMLASKLDIKETKKFPTPSQIQIIQYIVTSKKTVYQSELEDVLNLRRATVSGILMTMEKNGIIKRVASKKDARTKEIILNEKVEKIFLCHQSEMRMLENVLISGISDAELSTFSKVLSRMRENVSDYSNSFINRKEGK